MPTFIHVVTIAFMELTIFSSLFLLFHRIFRRWHPILHGIACRQVNILKRCIQWCVGIMHWNPRLSTFRIPLSFTFPITVFLLLIRFILGICLNLSRTLPKLFNRNVTLHSFSTLSHKIILPRAHVFFFSKIPSCLCIETFKRCGWFAS